MTFEVVVADDICIRSHISALAIKKTITSIGLYQPLVCVNMYVYIYTREREAIIL